MSEVERMIAELELAREQYASDKFLEEVKSDLQYSTSTAIKKLKEPLSALLIQNSGPLRERGERIVADLDVPENEISTAFRRVTEIMRGSVSAAIDLAERAVSDKLRELDNGSQPWDDALSEREYRDFLLEISVVGTPKSKTGVNEAATEALNSGKSGAVQFWSKHYRKLYQEAQHNPGPGPQRQHPDEKFSEIADALEAARRRAMNVVQSDRFRKAEEIRRTWSEEKMDQLLNAARLSVTPRSGFGSNDDPRNRPRQRTQAERELIDAEKRLAEAKKKKMDTERAEIERVETRNRMWQ